MKKRILSCLMALALCLTLLPTAALAEETEGTAQTPPAVEEPADPANREAKQENQPAETKQENQPAEAEQESQPAEQEEQQENSTVKQDEAVAAVQAMIDALPDAEELDGMDDEALDTVYEAFQTACDAYYDTLTEEQQAQLENTEKLAALSDWFNAQVAPLTEGSTAMTVSINKVALSAAAPYFPSNGTAAQAEKPDDNYAWFNAETSTLELHDFALDSGDIKVVSPVRNDPLTIALYGENTLSDGQIYAWNSDLEGDGAIYLTIEKSADAPSGSLSVTCSGNKWGAIMPGDLTVRGGAQVTLVKKDGRGDIGNCGINADGCNVIIEGEGTKLDVTNTETDKACGIRAKDVTVRDGASVAIAAPGGRPLFDPEGSSGMTATTLTVAKGTTVQGSFGGTTYRDITDDLNGDQMYLFKYLKISAAPIENHTHAIGVGTEYGDSSEVAFAHSLASNSDKKLLIDGRVVKHEQIPYSKFDDYGNNDVFVLPEGNYYLEDDISLMYPLAVTGEVNLCLNGKQIIQNYTYGKGMRFPTVIVRRDATLNLCDCRPEGAVGKITHASDMMGSGIEVRGKFKDVTGEAGVLNLYNAEISGNKQTSAGAANGGGVYNKGVVNMYGGKITDNAHTNGGGVGNSGTFTMYAGEITGNTANSGSFAEGGGVYSYGTFIMRGGSITGNHANIPGASYNIGGISNRGTFLVSGKVTISGNDGSNFFVNEGHPVQVDGKLDPSSVISLDMFQGTGSYKKDEVKIVVEGVTDENEGVFKKDRGEWYLTRIDGDKLVLHTMEKVHYHPVCGATCTHLDENGAPKHPNVLWEPTAILPKYAGNYYLTQKIDLTSTWTVPANIVLDLNGRNITQTSSVKDIAVIEVPANKSFTLTDCHTDDNNGGETRTMGSVKHEYANSQSGRGVVVKGNFTLYNGGITTNNCSTNYPPERLYSGAGVYVDGGGSFTMYGGKVAENIAMNGAGVYVNKDGSAAMYGGKITGNKVGEGYGAGVYVGGGTFDMYGGSISGNNQLGWNYNGDGGGVYINSGSFNLHDGTITGNNGYWGGGVNLYNGAFNMEGGKISNNTAGRNGTGGGVYVYNGTFTMTGGEISGNRSNGSGAGVILDGNGSFIMTGGKITGNTANFSDQEKYSDSTDAGVYVCAKKLANFSVGGSAQITGNHVGQRNSKTSNVYLSENTENSILKVMNVVSKFSEDAEIGVTTASTPAESGIQIAQGKDGYVISADDRGHFTPDATDQNTVVFLKENALYLGTHTHEWTYSGVDNTITAECGKSGCPAPDGGSVTINKPAHTTYGDGKEAAATVTSTLDSSITKSTITYKKGNDILDTAPTDAGTYTASITVGEGENAKTASVEYTIAKATPRVLSWMGYPRGWTFRENTPIANPTELTIANGTFKDVTRFEWYNATKNADNYTEGAKLDGNPTDAGDYIIKAVFEESNNVYAAVDALGLTISKAQHANNGDSIEVPLTVYPASGAYTYDVDIAKALNNIPHGGGLEPNTAYNGISIHSGLVKSAKWDEGKLYVTMNPLAGITGTTLGSITVNLTSKNYTVVPVVVNITLQPKREVPDISVSMDNWTYGENAKTPRYDVIAGVEATVTYAAQGSSDFSTTVPTNAGSYTVKVQYETAIEIHTGTANFTIAPKTLTKDDLIHSGPITKVYDGSTNAPSGLTVSVKHDSLVGSDTLAVSGTLKYNSANVNEAKQIIFTPTAITTGNYALAATEVLTITEAAITKAKQAPLTVTSTDATYGTDLTLTTDGGSGDGTVTYTVTDGTGKATIVDGSKLHPTKAGTVSVTATKSGGDNYEDVTSAAKEITIAKASYGDKDIPVSAKIGSTKTVDLTAWVVPGGSLSYLRKDDNFSVVENPSLDGSIFSFTVRNYEGVVEKVAYAYCQVSSDNYADYVINIKITATAKDKQTNFKFENGSVTKTYGDGDFTLAAAGEVKGSTVTYESSAPAVAEVDSATGKVTIKGAGTAVITAKASATEDYDEAAVTCTLTVGKKTVTVKAKDQTAYVGDKAPTLGADSCTVSGLVGEEKLTTQPTVKYVGADGKEITPDMTKTGEVKILAGGAAASDNYTIRYEDGKLTVSTRPSSGGGGSSRPSTHPVQAEVSKDPDGSVSLSKTNAAKGDKVTITVKPERHYEVDEVIVRDSKGKQLAVKDNGDGTFTFEMPADKVTVEPTFSWVNPFADVANSAYYVDAVEWMLKREVTQGTTETTFSPNLNCTRAQIVTFLWRAAGSPEPKGTVSFADVPAGSYYAKAVAWAVENGITGGTGDGLFSPDAACTRAQSAAFLYRAAGSPTVSGSAGFSDVAADAYYAQAVAWAKEHGITDGIGGGLFGSANDCTRAQIAAFLLRLYAEK